MIECGRMKECMSNGEERSLVIKSTVKRTMVSNKSLNPGHVSVSKYFIVIQDTPEVLNYAYEELSSASIPTFQHINLRIVVEA